MVFSTLQWVWLPVLKHVQYVNLIPLLEKITFTYSTTHFMVTLSRLVSKMLFFSNLLYYKLCRNILASLPGRPGLSVQAAD